MASLKSCLKPPALRKKARFATIYKRVRYFEVDPLERAKLVPKFSRQEEKDMQAEMNAFKEEEMSVHPESVAHTKLHGRVSSRRRREANRQRVLELRNAPADEEDVHDDDADADADEEHDLGDRRMAPGSWRNIGNLPSNPNKSIIKWRKTVSFAPEDEVFGLRSDSCSLDAMLREMCLEERDQPAVDVNDNEE
jgi:hypothetical protein